MTSTQETCRARIASASSCASIMAMCGAFTRDLLDGGGSRLACHFVLRPGAARAADGTDDFAAFDERNAAARGNHTVDRECVVILFQLNGFLEGLRFAPKAGRRSRFMFRHGNRCQLGAV